VWYKVFILPCGFRPGNAHKTRKTKSLFFVLCHGVPPIAVIDYIFNFCNDMVFYCLIYTHIFAHGVLNGQRLYNNIPLNDLIFLHRHMCAFFFRVAFSPRAKPITLIFTWKDFCTPASHSIWNRGLTTTGNGQEPCILISKVTQLHFHIRQSFIIPRECCFYSKLLPGTRRLNHSDLLICGLFWKKDFNPVFSTAGRTEEFNLIDNF